MIDKFEVFLAVMHIYAAKKYTRTNHEALSSVSYRLIMKYSLPLKFWMWPDLTTFV